MNEDAARIRLLMRAALDDAFKAQVMKLYAVWLSNPADLEPARDRAATGANTAIKVYRTAVSAIEQWEA